MYNLLTTIYSECSQPAFPKRGKYHCLHFHFLKGHAWYFLKEPDDNYSGGKTDTHCPLHWPLTRYVSQGKSAVNEQNDLRGVRVSSPIQVITFRMFPTSKTSSVAARLPHSRKPLGLLWHSLLIHKMAAMYSPKLQLPQISVSSLPLTVFIFSKFSSTCKPEHYV